MKMSKIEKKFVNSKRHGEKNLQMVEKLLEQFDVSAITKVLEIGCGVGVVSAHLNTKYKMNVIGTDLDPEQIELAKKHQKKNENLTFMEANATGLPFEEQEFNMALSLFVMHHIPNWDKALEEINRVLKPKGVFIFIDLAYSRFIKRIFKPIVRKFGVYTINDIIDFLKRKNFKIIYNEKPKGSIMKYHRIVFQKN